MIFEVGKSYPDMRMKPDGVFLSIDDSGLLITVLMDSPSKEEKRAFHQNSAFSVAAGRIFDLLFLCVKFGSLSWMDCTYTPHLGYTPLLPDVPVPLSRRKYSGAYSTDIPLPPQNRSGRSGERPRPFPDRSM